MALKYSTGLRNFLVGEGSLRKAFEDGALEFLEELKEIPKNRPQLMTYVSKYAQDILRNQEPMDRVSAKMRSLAFIYFLGGSLRAALVNFTQNYVTGIPFLAREVGAKSLKAEKLYHKAMFDVAMGKNISDTEQKMLDEMINKGVAEDQFIRQINREVKWAVGQVTGKVVDILSKSFSWIYSRYRLARTAEEKRKVIRDMQKFNLETRKYRGVIPPITATSMGQATQQKPEKPFVGFGRMMETYSQE